ncbi:MAG TPA: choice-of-anchor Q domain-containing protein [Flavisolibacter sp.]|nr:choice-of-anchor Q domain-containing protein [Flavisolibacter sp.]
MATISFILFFSCTKESYTNSSSALLSASTDSLHFDTIFTTAGSITQMVKIFNNNEKGIHVSSVRLAGGLSSAFRINVNGAAGPQVSDLDIAANDSAYIFVTVSINQNASALPFIVRDSIALNYNGNEQFIQLDAYGKNAHFFKNRTISIDETWTNDKPYVITGKLTVAPGITLSIEKGCKIYIHADAPFIIEGTLKINGNDSTRVVFTGDRLDQPYKDFPGSYPGLTFTKNSNDNVFNYAVIQNAYQGIVVTGPSSSVKLTLNETIIDNAYDAGLTGNNTNIVANNLLVSNCGKNIVLNGGTYNFTHCTATAYTNSFIQHKDPCLSLSNYYTYNNAITPSGLTAVFRNCIFWGESNGMLNDEVTLMKQGNTACNITFDQVLWKVQNTPADAIIHGAINNQDPLFDSVNTFQRIYNFRLKDGSPAIDKGVNTSINTDLDGHPRPVNLPDLGAYEKQ